MEKSKLLKETNKYNNKVFGTIEWDSNDGDYVSKRLVFEANKFFEDELLLKLLTFITTPYNFKKDDWNGVWFGHHIAAGEWMREDSEYHELHDKIYNILKAYDLLIYTDDGVCHTVSKLNLYYLDNDKFYEVDFSSLRDGWNKMTYEEIINSILELDKSGLSNGEEKSGIDSEDYSN